MLRSNHGDNGGEILVRILAVDVAQRIAHIVDKHGGKSVAAWKATNVVHQVPATGERWIACKQDWHLLLDKRVESEDDAAIGSALVEGDVHFKAPGAVKLNDGNLGYTTWEQFAVNGSQTTVTLAVAPVHLKSIQVFLAAGGLLAPQHLTLSGAVLTFDTPPSAQTITVYYERT